jgi:hypothetical protein
VAIVRLPVASVNVVLRLPAGAEDLLLLEAGRPDLRVALALFERLVEGLDGAPLVGADLPLGDVDVLLLRLRQEVVGDLVRADTFCPACHTRVDIAFSIQDYLAHHEPGGPPPVVAADEPGWYRLADCDVELRVPRAADQLAIALSAEPEEALVARCVRAAELSDDLRDRVEAALEVLAPSLCGELEGVCPQCETMVRVGFDPLLYTLRELRDRATHIYEDVAWIAHHFHWSEAEILALPAARRMRYAELASAQARQTRTS